MSGLKFLYNLILKDAIKGSGKASGIMSIGPDIRKITMNKYAKYVDSAKRQNVDLDKLSEQEIKYMLEMNQPKGLTIGGHRVIDATSSEGKGITNDLFNMLDRQSGKNVIKTDFGKPFAEEVGSADNIIKNIKNMEPIDAMKEANSVIGRKGVYKNLTPEESKKILKDTEDHIFERDIPIDPEDLADGGVAGLLGERTGYSEGNGVADKDAQQKKFSERVIKLMDEEGFEFGEAVKEAMKEGYASGGRAGLYRGGQAEIEPDLSGIGHGSDALMARNMLIAPGSQATTSTGLNYLLGEDNDTTRVPYKDAGPVVLPKPKPKPNADPLIELQRIYDLYQESMPGVSQETQKYLQQDFIQKLNDAGISQEQFMTNQMQNNFANGGPARQNFKMGKRAFLKLIGGVGAGIAGIKTGLLGLGKKTVAKSVIAPAAQAANEAGIPPYFFKLVNKIKLLGDDVTETSALTERQTVKRYKDFELTEDTATGRIEIQRVKVAEDMDYYGSPITEETFMGYSPGEEIFQETAKGKTKIIKAQPKYEEGTTYLRNDGPETGSVLDESTGISDDIFREVGEEVPEAIRKGKAEGGRIGYKLGKKVIQEGIPSLIKKVNKLFNKEVVTTADKLPIPKKTLDRDMFRQANKRLNKKRQLTDTEIQDYEMELGDSETWMSEGTLGEAENALKNYKAYQDDMFRDYKAGKLDPVAGDKSQARKIFLQNKLNDMEGSGDKRLMTRDEIEELSTFDLGVELEAAKKAAKKASKIDDDIDISQGMIDLDEMNFTKNAQAAKKAIDNASINTDLLKAKLMERFEPKKKILGMSEEDILMKKYPGMSKGLAEQIANDPDPVRKADVISMVEQTMEMGKRGMSGDEIIQIFKKGTDRTKQATGGLASILGE
jgi:hypothetical protein